MTKVQLGAFQREASELDFLSSFSLRNMLLFSLIDVSRILMMLWHNGEIHQIMVSEVLHIVSMVHRAVMYLTLVNLLHGIIIMESSSAAYHIDNLAVALMSMKTS